MKPRATRWMMLKPGALLATGLVALLACASGGLLVRAQSQELTVSASFADKQSIMPLEQIGLRLSRALRPSEGRLAIFIGQTDMTALFATTGTELSYNPKNLPLPAGESQVTVYLVSPENQWKQIAQFPLRVADNATPQQTQPITQQQAIDPSQQQATNGKKWAGFDKADFTPSITLSLKSQPARSSFPDTNRPERPTFTDLSLQGNVRTELARGLFGSQTQFDIVGTSYQKEALRFGQLGDGAPQIDLSSYLMQFQAGKTKFQVGSVSFGTNRYLINSFSSRGITLTFPITPRSDFSIAAANGTSIVGWSNFFGLSRRKHQVVSGTLGHEFLRERPGGLRLEGGLLYGSLLPISNFNQGSVTDAERSRGLGLRLIASDARQRLRLDGGFARSRFNNPADPLLNQGFDVVAVRETARNARYVDASYDLLKDYALSPTRKANLTFNFRHETIDPLYRSVAAFVQADRFQNSFELVGNVADVNATFAYNRSNDNLDDIPSILKTLSRRMGLMLGAPLVSLLGNPAKPSPWYPRLSYSFERLRQFGAFFPINSGFTSPSQVPDQINTNQNLSAEWQAQKWRFGYRLNNSFQNNRQAGRERADFLNWVNGLTFGYTPVSAFDLSLDLNLESASNKEQNRTDRTNRIGTNINWRMTGRAALAAMLSTTFAGDVAKTSRSRNAELDLQWSYKFGLERSRFRKVQGQFFVRYANRYARTRDNLFGLNNLTKVQTFNTGLSFTFF